MSWGVHALLRVDVLEEQVAKARECIRDVQCDDMCASWGSGFPGFNGEDPTETCSCWRGETFNILGGPKCSNG